MCSAVLLLALLAAIDPVRIGITALLITRPKPMLNLVAFWLGGIAGGVGAACAVLLFLRDVTLTVIRAVNSASSNPITGYVQTSAGAFAVAFAVLLVVRSAARQREAASVRTGEPAGVQRKSSVRSRLERGSLWVAFIAGMALATPPVEYMAAILAIVASEPAAPAQVAAALAFTVVAFTIVELPLVTYATAPAKTLAVVRRINSWISARSQAIPVVIVGAIGFMLFVGGVSRIG